MEFKLAAAAKKLGSDMTIMDSYWKYHERQQNWFFSPNYSLDNATKRPASFPSPEAWNKLKSKEREKKWQDGFTSKQRMTISSLAGFGYEGRGISLDNSHHFDRLRAGYLKWRSDLYSIFWSDDSVGKRWLCNVFVGDAIYLCNRTSFTSANKHYFDPRQIHAGQSFLHKRKSFKEVQVGDVVVFGTHHTEIIVELRKNQSVFGFKADDGFCAIGAGRGYANNDTHNEGDGKIKCDTSTTFKDTRELENSDNSYYYL